MDTSDLLIMTRGRRVLIVGNTTKGLRWLKENVISDSPNSVIIEREFLEDFIIELKEAHLSYAEH